MLKKSLFSPAQPRRAETRLFPCIVLASFRSSTGTRPPHHSAARTDLVLLIRRTVRPRGYASGLHSLRPCLRKGASWRAGVGRVRSLAILSILRNVLLLAQYMWVAAARTLQTIYAPDGFRRPRLVVAAMKGTILSIHPDTRIVDLSHQIAPYRIDEAGYFLKSCYREFPAGAIHVVVVDPGVGSVRRAIVVQSARYFFLAPDNGVLTSISTTNSRSKCAEIDQRKFRRESPGHTFDGRDLFAPAAARLARHEPFESYGPVIGDYRTLPLSQPHWEQTTLVGEIVYVDRFGNLISNLTPAHLEEARSLTKRRQLLIRIGERIIEERVNSYSEGMVEKPSLLINSDGRLEIFLKEASAADLLQVGRGARIEVL